MRARLPSSALTRTSSSSRLMSSSPRSIEMPAAAAGVGVAATAAKASSSAAVGTRRRRSRAMEVSGRAGVDAGSALIDRYTLGAAPRFHPRANLGRREAGRAAGGTVNDFTRLVDLASARLGGRVLWANDEFFAEKENLLRPEKPVFREHEYTDRGKWMDGWETRRRRTPGHDWCLVRLGLPGILRGVVVEIGR